MDVHCEDVEQLGLCLSFFMYHGKEICLPFAGLVWLNLRNTFFLKLFLQRQYILLFASEINNHHPSGVWKGKEAPVCWNG